MAEGWVTSIIIGIILMGAGVIIFDNQELKSLTSLGGILFFGGIVS